jgi:hypothetical protein
MMKNICRRIKYTYAIFLTFKTMDSSNFLNRGRITHKKMSPPPTAYTGSAALNPAPLYITG